MTRTVLAIIAIFLCTAAGWMILGTTIIARTYSAGSALEPRVSSSWGGPHQQAAPMASTSRTVKKQVQETSAGHIVSRTVVLRQWSRA